MSTPDWDAVPPYGGPPQQPWGPPGQHPQQQWGPPAQYPPAQYPPAQYPPAQYGSAPYGPPPYASSPWGPPPYGSPQPGWGPRPPQRPGSVIGAAVVAFASTLLVLVGTVYALAFSALLSLASRPDSGIGGWVALVQLALAALLVVGGIRVLGHDRRWLLGAAVLQLGMSLYWVTVLGDLVASTFSDTAVVLPLLYGALAVVAGGLLLLPDARSWTSRRPGPPDTGG